MKRGPQSGFSGFSGFAMGDKKRGRFEDTEERKRPPPAALLGFDDEEAASDRHHDAKEEPNEEKQNVEAADAEDEVDPLDAFMEGIHDTVKKEKAGIIKPAQTKALVAEFEEEDPLESFMKHMKEKEKEEREGNGDDVDDDDLDYDSDDNPLVERKKEIEALAPLDHSQIHYESFKRDFYVEPEEVTRMTEAEVHDYRQMYDIRVEGAPQRIPRPAKAFEHFRLPDKLQREIERQGFGAPTPVQKQAVPCVMRGLDVVAQARTGSGKTLAYVLPMLVHLLDQPALAPGDGPIAIILAPTRELAAQIHRETRKFAKRVNVRVGAVYGGKNTYDQAKELKAGVEVVVATPGRLIHMVRKGTLSMRRVTYMVLDEADRMLDLGFEPQVRSIAGQTRPDRQTMLFSATFKRGVEQLVSDLLTHPVRINIGTAGEAHPDVQQVVHIMQSDTDKWPWLMEHLSVFAMTGQVLIFVATKHGCELLSRSLEEAGFACGGLHGDKAQAERTSVVNGFRAGRVGILVATDVAARGLDIPTVRTVVNYDVARDIHSHIHRVGRTGRAGQSGVAYTLITRNQSVFAAHLTSSLQAAKQNVPPELLQLASTVKWFRRTGGVGGGAPHSHDRNRRDGGGEGAPRRTSGIGFGGSGGGGRGGGPGSARGRGGHRGGSDRGRGGGQGSGSKPGYQHGMFQAFRPSSDSGWRSTQQ